ncbi:MAG TPA: UDP-N-acetylmuramate--L-alanine ligase [Acidimicrobiales bacterium]|nr:UDP-N-acetylmuramate--L-alanine ligase [Acidimicrobiales bacterium]
MLTRPLAGDFTLTGGRQRIHIVGVGGASMNAIATVLVAMGHEVSGSDSQDSPVLARLRGLGVRVYLGHEPANVGDADLVAYSSAIDSANAELAEARRRGIRLLRRAEILAALCATRRTLAVGGTSGKTTTTAMLAWSLERAGMEPCYLVGGDLARTGSGARWTSGEWLVVEADESDGTFLQLGAEGIIVTSVEPDHLEHYGGLDALVQAFERFVTEAKGPRLVCIDDPGAAAVAARVGVAMTYGQSPGADYRISTTELDAAGTAFEVMAKGKPLGRYELRLPGMHNVRNATAALAVALEVGAPVDAVRGALGSFAGVSRRFELRGSYGGVTYIDDYAHLPGKVRAALGAARQQSWGRVIAVFQPHRYSRTAALWRDFADAFEGADMLVVTGIYGAGEPPRPGVSGRLVADSVRGAHPDLPVEYVEERAELVELLRHTLRPGDLCLTMGAGDLTTLPSELLGRKAEEAR